MGGEHLHPIIIVDDTMLSDTLKDYLDSQTIMMLIIESLKNIWVIPNSRILIFISQATSRESKAAEPMSIRINLLRMIGPNFEDCIQTLPDQRSKRLHEKLMHDMLSIG